MLKVDSQDPGDGEGANVKLKLPFAQSVNIEATEFLVFISRSCQWSLGSRKFNLIFSFVFVSHISSKIN